jgi:Glycosyltransferase family 87
MTSMPATPRRRRIALAILVLAGCLSVIQGLDDAVIRPGGSQDTQWSGSRALLEHSDPYALYLHNPVSRPFILAQNPNYPASGLVMLWPYAAWSWPVAKWLWAASNLVFTLLVLWCLFRLLPAETTGTTRLLIAALFLCGTPWRNNLGNGQHAVFVLAFFLLAVVLLPRHTKIAGLPLAVSWFKYSISFPLSLFFARSRRGWKTLLAAGGVHAALTIFAAAWTATSVLALLAGPLRVAHATTGRGYVDVFALAARMGSPSALLPAAAACLILGVTYAAVRRDEDDLSSLSTLSLAAMAVVFHQVYDFVVLVIPLSYALRERAATARARYYLVLVGVIWFADRAVDAAAARHWTLEPAALFAVYFWLKILLFYGALGADWVIGLRADRAAAAALAGVK